MVKAERGIHRGEADGGTHREGGKDLQMVKAERGIYREVRQIEASTEKGARAPRW